MSAEELTENRNATATDSSTATVASTTTTALPGSGLSSDVLQARVKQTLRGAVQEWFEPGMESALSREITELLFTHSLAYIAALTPYLLTGEPTEEVAAQVAITLGRIHHQVTRSERLTLLLQLLESPSFTLRDAALIGLSYANDRSVVQTLKTIMARTADPGLRDDIANLVADLSS